MTDMRAFISLVDQEPTAEPESLNAVTNFGQWAGNDSITKPFGDDVATDTNFDHVADLVHQGYVTGDGWELHIGDEVRGDEFALERIANMIRSGATSGSYPHWSLSSRLAAG